MRINNNRIGAGEPVYVIGELSGNHNRSIDRALETIRSIAAAGAHAVKLQTYRPDTITLDMDGPDFTVPGDGPWGGRRLFDLYDEAHTPYEWHRPLFDEALRLGLDVFSTPFDDTAVDLLESLEVPAYKIASFELTDDALLQRVARTGKPLIVSTGMASLAEIAHALDVIRGAGGTEVALLKCTSSYPAPDETMNLASIPVLAAATGCPIGLSDHSRGSVAPVVAVAFGACIIEKHVTLLRGDGGVDSHFSMEPPEFAELIADIRRAERMIGRPRFGATAAEEGNLVFRRSLYAVNDISAGEAFSAGNVRSIRPGHGLPPRFLPLIVGRAATRNVPRGTALSWQDVTREPGAEPHE